MCLSDAFELVDGERRPLMSYVSGISVDEKGVTLTDMLGARKTVAGTLKSVDLTRNVILIEAKKLKNAAESFSAAFFQFRPKSRRAFSELIRAISSGGRPFISAIFSTI